MKNNMKSCSFNLALEMIMAFCMCLDIFHHIPGMGMNLMKCGIHVNLLRHISKIQNQILLISFRFGKGGGVGEERGTSGTTY